MARDEQPNQVEAFPDRVGKPKPRPWTAPSPPPAPQVPEGYAAKDILRTEVLRGVEDFDGRRQRVGFALFFRDGSRWDCTHGNWRRVWSPRKGI